MTSVALKVKSPDITFHWDEKPYDAFYAEIHATGLLQDHWNEVGTFRNIYRLNPQHDRYRNLEKAGYLHILMVRDAGRLVGYFTVLLAPHPRDIDVLVGAYDNLYCKREYRRFRLGIKMQEEGMRKLEALGAHVLHFGERASHSDKPGRRGGYLEHYGFVKVETMYAKILRNPHGDA